MDSCHRADAWSLGFNLSGNGISGAIPESVINHPNWSELGWDIVAQNPFKGDIIAPPEYKLRIDDKSITIMNTNITTTIYDLLAKNEVTVVYNISGGETCLETIDFTKERVNLHLDYHNKGLGTVYCFRYMDYVDPWMQKMFQKMSLRIFCLLQILVIDVGLIILMDMFMCMTEVVI